MTKENSDSFTDQIKRSLKEAKASNVEAEKSLPVINLQINSDHVKSFIIAISSIVVFFIMGLIGVYVHIEQSINEKFLFLDSKIERKLDYLNLRIDSLSASNITSLDERAQPVESNPSQETTKSENTKGE